MPALKYSRQRESIKRFLMSRYDHPTADTIYLHVREEFLISVWEPFTAICLF